MNRSIKLLLIFVLIVACSKVPITGRKQVIIIPESQLLGQSFNQYSQTLKSSKVIRSGSDAQLVKKVGNKIRVAVEKYMKQNGLQDQLEDYKWEFNLIDNDQANAWCMPGGKVAFYTGILPFTKDEDGMAVVMGHEIAHAIAKHGAERMSQSLLTSLGGVALKKALEDTKGKNYWMAAYGAGAGVGIILPFSRLHESEADKLGVIFMTMAGYDPNKSIEFWTRMSKSGNTNVPEILSTHPSNSTRIKNLKKYIQEAQKYIGN